MKNFIDLKGFSISLTICGLISLGASYFFDLDFLVTFGITIAALLINGLVATLEDEMPSGFSNPTNEKRNRDEN